MGRSVRQEERNERARARLLGAVPDLFPRPVLIHALARRWVPPLPRLAVESYWTAHPVRADRLCRALAAATGHPAGWTWQASRSPGDGALRGMRSPPAPFREAGFHRGPGSCCVCGQPVYRFGWHRDLWGEGRPNRRAAWHACCVAAWKLWMNPIAHGPLIRRLGRRRCGVTGERLLRNAEIDHRVPLVTAWREHRDAPWPALLRFWGIPNLQAVNQDAHRAKSAREAVQRARSRGPAASHAPSA